MTSKNPPAPSIREVLTELPQAKIRIALHTFFVALTFLAHHFDPRIALSQIVVVSLAAMLAAGFLYAWAVSLQRRKAPLSERKLQRAACLFSDNLFVTLVLFIGGASTAGLWAIYLWTSIGYGVRYGVNYLKINVMLSVLCFLGMAHVTPFWLEHKPFVLGMGLGMIFVPLYTSFLITKLHDAVSEREVAYRARSEFLARMSHELRTPLHAIISSAELLRDTFAEKLQNDYVDSIELSSKTLLELINRVLDLSKFESGDVGLASENVCVAQVVGQAANVLYPQAHGKGLMIGVALGEDLPRGVLGSTTHLREVLLNLMGNAVKFTDDGAVDISVSADWQSDARVLIGFRIIDTGCGIRPSDLTRIFEPFVQADTSKTRKHDGTGLGTSYARELIRLMGGEITLTSEEGVGTSVSFQIPFNAAVEDEFPPVDLRTLTLLTAPERNDWAEKLMSSTNISSKVETSLPTLIERISASHHSQAIDAVLIDAAVYAENLPNVIRSIRRASPAKLIPVAVIGGAATRTVALNGGASVFIARESDPYAVKERLRHLLALTIRDAPHQDWPRTTREPFIRSLRVLVADDNATNRRIAQVALERAGHTCTLVDNGDEALFALNDDAYDVALLDMHMPRRHGIEVAKIYHFSGAANPAHTPIILLTADTTLETREEAASAGITTFLTKPILPSEIVRIVEEVGRNGEDVATSTPEQTDPERTNARAVARNSVAVSQSEELPILDFAAISELISLMEKAEQKQFFSEFAEDARDYIRALRNAQILGDYSPVRDAMHSLAGAAGIIGAVRLSRLAKLVETSEHSVLALRAAEYLAELEQATDETMRQIGGLESRS